MWNWILLFCLVAVFSGCVLGGYQPGIRGVRDLPQTDYYASGYGWVNNSDGSKDSCGPSHLIVAERRMAKRGNQAGKKG